MAKKKSTRRKARKPKFIEISGHRLTEAMHIDYLRCKQSRMSNLGAQTIDQIEYKALDAFLAGYRPSRKIKGQLSEIYHTISRAILAVGAMQEYPFFAPEPASVRSAGSKVLREMGLELYNASAKLTAIAMNVEAEETTKLQDWLAGDERVARIGRGAEVAHVASRA